MRDFGWFENEIWDASWHLFAGLPVLTYDTYFAFVKKKHQAKRNLMSALEIRNVLDGISEACSVIVYFYIWNLTWINIWRIEETKKYCEWNWGDLLLPLFLFMEASLPCDVSFAIVEFRYI